MTIAKNGYEVFWLTGARMYIIRDDDTKSTLFDLGTISEAVQPTLEVNTTTLMDGEGGRQQPVDEAVIGIDESWEITVGNLSPANLALWYLSGSPTDFDQPTGADIAAVSHTAVIESGGFIKLVDANGNWLYNLASATVATYTEDTDWKWHDNDGKQKGIIEVIDGGGITDGETLTITMVLNSLTGKRLIKPHSEGKAIKGKAMVVYSRNARSAQTVREAEVSLVPSGNSLSPTEHSTLTFTARVLSDITDTDTSGRLLQTIGAVPETASGS